MTQTHEPEASVQHRQETTISAATVDHFPYFSRIILLILRTGFLQSGGVGHLLKPWMQFIRSVIFNAEVDRRQTFTSMVAAILNINLSVSLHEAWLTLKLIEVYVHAHPPADTAFRRLHVFLIQSLCSGQGITPEYFAKCPIFLALQPEILIILATNVVRLW
jgi:hypothetical protein